MGGLKILHVQIRHKPMHRNVYLFHVNDHEGGDTRREEDKHGDDVDERIPLHFPPIPLWPALGYIQLPTVLRAKPNPRVQLQFQHSPLISQNHKITNILQIGA